VINAKMVVHEENSGTVTLVKLEPGRSTPTSKFFNVKYHCFQEHLNPKKIVAVKVQTDEQLGDIFTKGLRLVKFVEMRRQLWGYGIPLNQRTRGSADGNSSVVLEL
jgi:hypothetical protein